MVFVFAFLLTLQGACIGYAIYIPPYVFIGQFAGKNSGTMAAIYGKSPSQSFVGSIKRQDICFDRLLVIPEVSAAVGGMMYLASMQLSLAAAGWSGVWMLETVIAAMATVGMAAFTLMDCQGGDEFKGGRFDGDEIRRLFRRIDSKQTGYIDREELTQFLLSTFDGRACIYKQSHRAAE